MALEQVDIDKFLRGRTYGNPRFWSRLGQKPDFRGARVLDFGCGRGALCVDIAVAGAQKVIGLDVRSGVIRFARENLRQNFPELMNIVEFTEVDLKCYDDAVKFDHIVSKDVFEHIIDLDGMLSELKKRLKLGGRIFAGFGPLYTSPYGDHNRLRVSLRPWGLLGRLLALIPWGHLFLEPITIRMYNRHHKKKVSSIYDFGLNKKSVSDFRKILRESGLAIADFRVNQTNSILIKVLSLPRKIPFLEDYFTFNIYCILENNRYWETGSHRDCAGNSASVFFRLIFQAKQTAICT